MDETGNRVAPTDIAQTDIEISLGPIHLQGILGQPRAPCAVVVFAHGSGSGRLSSRNQAVAASLQRDGIATLLFDLLTAEEEHSERETRHLRFDIPLLAQRLLAVTHWLGDVAALAPLRVGYFGASTGAAAALVAAADAPVHAVVSRGGRPDLAGPALSRVRAPTLLIVGGRDTQVIALNRRAMTQMTCEQSLAIVPRAGHLFEEPGTLQEVMHLSRGWFKRHLCDVRSAA
ncbi:MAG: dienelactone hydrolase family protein [Lysobacter sp.]